MEEGVRCSTQTASLNTAAKTSHEHHPFLCSCLSHSYLFKPLRQPTISTRRAGTEVCHVVVVVDVLLFLLLLLVVVVGVVFVSE